MLSRAEDQKAKDNGQFGLAARYISQALGETEFGFYAMNIHSRVPVISGIKHALSTGDEGAIAAAAAGQYNASPEVFQAVGFATPQSYAAAKIGQARAGDTRYFAVYPEDIQLLGVSFATTVGTVALSGEVSYKQNVPLQINAPMLINAALTGSSSSQELADAVNATPAHGVVDGYRSFDVSQIQLTAVQFLDRLAGASRVTLIGEVGYTFVGGLDESADAIKFSRPGVFEPESGFEKDGYVSESSWGYRARIMADYPDVFSGVNVQPIVAWSHDVAGFAPQPGGAFREGNQSLGLTLKADYLAKYNAAISYTQYMGGDFNILEDRDFASLTIGMQF